MSAPENKECTQACAQASAQSVAKTDTFQVLHKLVVKMTEIEQDPDMVSVFSIARAHGYKVTSKFWHEELKTAVEYLNSVLKRADEESKVLKEAAPAESPVVPFEK